MEKNNQLDGVTSSDWKRLKKYYEKKNCIICNRPYYVRKRNNKRSNGLNIRQKHSLTCSKKCARIRVRKQSIKKKKKDL